MNEYGEGVNLDAIRMRLVDVPENSVLARDVFWQRKRLIAAGSVLSNILLDLISRRNIEYIYIQQEQRLQQQVKDHLAEYYAKRQDLSAELAILNEIVVNEIAEEAFTSGETMENRYSNQYLRALVELNTEVRYGRVLANHQDVDFVRELFVSLMEQEQYRDYINKLSAKDHDSYLQAIDVFTLGVLFMRRCGLANYKRLSIGFLLHDIGKLRMPPMILKKQGKLTKPEYEQMKRHTIDGYNLLVQMEAEDIAYLALSHHERVDGSGYPQGLKLMQLPREVRILQLLDMYSAITQTRVYREGKSVLEAIRLLFQEKHLVDEELLLQFVDFLGIYPENSFVLLSDGSHATVEVVNELFPLLPTVRIFQTGESIALPMDFQLTIQKLITYYVETPDELFYKFTDYLISSNEDMGTYYAKLKEHYKTFEWFTHLYIPAYQIFHILQSQNMLQEESVEQGDRQLAMLLKQTINELRQINHNTSYVLVVVDEQTIHANAASLLEGILHTEGVYSVVIPYSHNAQELHEHLGRGHFSRLIMLGDKELPVIGAELVDVYHFTESNLQKMLFHLASIRLTQVNMLQELEKYQVVQALIKQA